MLGGLAAMQVTDVYLDPDFIGTEIVVEEVPSMAPMPSASAPMADLEDFGE